MKYEMIFSGFGGQGIMLMGQLLAQAGLEAGRHVSWFPSYGPEMRGGTAFCSIIISDAPIGSPVVTSPDVVAAMNLPSLHRFAPQLKPGGTLIINSSLVDARSPRTDIHQLAVPMSSLAEALKAPKALNVIGLGVVAGAVHPAPNEAFFAAMETILGKKFANKPGLLDLNKQAFLAGCDAAA